MIALFVLKMVAGITMTWLLMPRREVSDGFFRIQMWIVLALAVLAALLLTRDSTWELSRQEIVPAEFTRTWQLRLAVMNVVAAYFGSICWALGRRLPGGLCIYLLALGSVSALLLHSLQLSDSPAWLQLLSDFSSAAVLGSVLTGMLLGHWYLTTPTMSIRPLSWFNVAICLAGLSRLAASGVALGMFGLSLPDVTHVIWFAIRWIGAILVPLLAAILVWRILKYRNTQSATGVLFAGLILVLMGEMSAAMLERDVQIPY